MQTPRREQATSEAEGHPTKQPGQSVASSAWLERLGPSEEMLCKGVRRVPGGRNHSLERQQNEGPEESSHSAPGCPARQCQVFTYSVASGSLQASLSHHQMPQGKVSTYFKDTASESVDFCLYASPTSLCGHRVLSETGRRLAVSPLTHSSTLLSTSRSGMLASSTSG